MQLGIVSPLAFPAAVSGTGNLPAQPVLRKWKSIILFFFPLVIKFKQKS